MKTVTIIGTGLLGGSLALALKDKSLAEYVVGVDACPENRVDAIPLEAVKILNKVNSQVVMDMGSTKGELCEVIGKHPRRGRFVASHPMWGTEKSGPMAAEHGAFTGRAVVICQSERSDADAIAIVENLYTQLGMPIKYMQPEDHDMHTAYISHISHITSYALALTVLEKEREDSQIFDLASAGFATTVRLAKSSPSMWTPIFLKNKYNVLDVLRENIHQLQIFRKLIEQDDAKGIEALITKANGVGRIL
ncbi:MAG: prephenate dehydrogenase/arogenate dehydrogenase family protein [Mucinivorans sp.]